MVHLSSALKALAVSLFKIANDIRWMGSGPVSGLGDLKIPALQPGILNNARKSKSCNT